MILHIKQLLSSFTVFFLLAGCATGGLSGSTYSRAEARTAQHVEHGVVESIRRVKIEGTKSAVGAFSGALVGGAATRGLLRHDRNKGLWMIVGMIGGAIAGAAAEEGLTQKNGLEIMVQLKSGKTIAVVQEEDSTYYAIGQQVTVLSSHNGTRVVN